jgi:hypothetical protein
MAGGTSRAGEPSRTRTPGTGDMAGRAGTGQAPPEPGSTVVREGRGRRRLGRRRRRRRRERRYINAISNVWTGQQRACVRVRDDRGGHCTSIGTQTVHDGQSGPRSGRSLGVVVTLGLGIPPPLRRVSFRLVRRDTSRGLPVFADLRVLGWRSHKALRGLAKTIVPFHAALAGLRV